MGILHAPRFFGDQTLGKILDGSAVLSSSIAGPADTVKRLQLALNNLLIPSQPLAVDGVFGGKTAQAVQDFKVKRGVTPINGQLDSNTVAALDNNFLFELIDNAAALATKPFELGFKISGRREVNPDFAICEFEHGAVMELAHILALIVPATVYASWKAAVGSKVDFGTPATNPIKLDDARYYQEFTNSTYIFNAKPSDPTPEFAIRRDLWESSISGRARIGLPTGPSEFAGPDGAHYLPHDNGVVLKVLATVPQVLPQKVFDVWVARETKPNASRLGAPIAMAYHGSDDTNPVFQFLGGQLPDSGTGPVVP